MKKFWEKVSHLGLGKRKRNDEGTSLGEDANLDDRSRFPTLLPKHKIFLSHSGKQKWFVEKLCEDLEARHRFPFFDKRPSSLPKGKRFPKLILEAAEQCEMAVVVVSEEYLTSKWPMIELNTFVQALSGSNPKLKILPLFFGMSVEEFGSPSRWAAWLKTWKEWAKDDARIKPVEFEGALKVMRSFNGIKFSGNMDNLWSFEEDVVKNICSAIAADVKWEDSHVQGRSAMCEATREKIKVIEPSEEYGICVFGYYGVGGIGKTTMCKTLCDELLEFSGKVCHIELGGTQSKEQMMKEVLKKLTNTSEELLQGLDEGHCLNILKNPTTWRQKTFLAIDNVWGDNKSVEQAQMFLDEPAFHEGSVVMVTSRCHNILTELGIEEAHCFEVPELGKGDARKLFLHHAAKGKQFASDEDNGVIDECLARCHFQKGETQGFHYLPLALKVLGVHLRRLRHSPAEWSKDLPTVSDFDRFPGDNPVFSIIRLSYDRLSEQLQALFMDVAVFSPEMDPDKETTNRFKWLSAVHKQTLQETRSQLQQLEESGLLEDVDLQSERVSMHDLYKEFAEMEAKGKLNSSACFKSRRWVYCSKSSCPWDLETTPSGGYWENLIRVCIDLDSEGAGGVVNVDRIQWRYFPNLVVLKLRAYYNVAPGVLNLRGLRCLRSLDFKNLRRSDGAVEGVEELNNLKYFCWYGHLFAGEWNGSSLGHVPVSLEVLDMLCVNVCLRSDVFDHCTNLRDLSLGGIRASASIDLRRCTSLRSVSLSCILGLEKLVLATGLQSCLQSLRILGCPDLSGVSGLADLDRLERLAVYNSPLLEELPDLQKFTNLRHLSIKGPGRRCEDGSWKFPIVEVRGLGSLGQLRELHCNDLDVTELPDLSALEHLHVLDINGCKKLTTLEGVAGLTALRHVVFSGCESLLRLPDLSNSTKLESLDLSGSGIELHEEDIDMLAALPRLSDEYTFIQ